MKSILISFCILIIISMCSCKPDPSPLLGANITYSRLTINSDLDSVIYYGYERNTIKQFPYTEVAVGNTFLFGGVKDTGYIKLEVYNTFSEWGDIAPDAEYVFEDSIRIQTPIINDFFWNIVTDEIVKL